MPLFFGLVMVKKFLLFGTSLIIALFVFRWANDKNPSEDSTPAGKGSFENAIPASSDIAYLPKVPVPTGRLKGKAEATETTKTATVNEIEIARTKVRELKQALAREPENAKVMADLGATLAQQLHSPDEGIPHLEKSILLSSDDGKAFYDSSGSLHRSRAHRARGIIFE